MAALAVAAAAQAAFAAAGVYAGANAVSGVVVPLLAAALIAARVRGIEAERPAWALVLVTLGLLLTGNLYALLAFPDPSAPPVPTAHALGLWVVAEGSSPDPTGDALRALGYDAAQGFFLARPAPIEVVAGSLADADAAA
jgi:hypothetical protein